MEHSRFCSWKRAFRNRVVRAIYAGVVHGSATCDKSDYMDNLSGICAHICDTDIKNVKRIPDRNFYQACLMYFCADSVVASPPWLVSLRQAGI